MNKIEKIICATAGFGALCTAASLVFLSVYADQNTATQNFKRGDIVFLEQGEHEKKTGIVTKRTGVVIAGYGGDSEIYKGTYNVMVYENDGDEEGTLLLTTGANMVKISEITASTPVPAAP